MIIRSIRLKNIKSYGEGSEGKGITVTFEPGVNRIAGKNGHGKTTLIESLGYALFLTRPQFEETFDADTYFLRSGHKSGEMDVTFTHGGETFRIERGLGSQSKRRSKVIQVSDGSTCAENEEEVSLFLCRLLGFPDSQRFSELFSKLVGVKQGRLTWPFDSRPSDAKRFFEPLLDVAVFRDCFDRLKPAVDRFNELLHEQDTKLSAVTERIRERANCTEAHAAAQQAVCGLQQQLAKLAEERFIASKTKEQLELKESALKLAERRRDASRSALDLAIQRRETSEHQVKESHAAAQIAAGAALAFQTFEQAEKVLKDLRGRQIEQRRLEKDKAEAARRKTEIEAKAQGARSQAETFSEQKRVKQTAQVLLREKLLLLRQNLDSTRESFEQRKSLALQAAKDLPAISHFIDSLPRHFAVQQAALKKIAALSEELAAWDPSELEGALHRELAADQALQDARRELAETRERLKTLSGQLAEIRGGVCPFLREQCRQFKPDDVGTNFTRLSAQTKELENRIEPVNRTYQAAKAVREKLQHIQAGLAEKRSQVQVLSREFASNFTGIFPAALLATTARLQHWAPSIAAFPLLPAPPAEDAPLPVLRSALQESAAHAQAIGIWWQAANQEAQAKLAAFSQEEQARVAEQQNGRNQTLQLKQLEDEISGLIAKETTQRECVRTLVTQGAEVAQSLATLEQQLLSHASLSEDINGQEQIQQAHRASYLKYIEAKPLADQLGPRQTELAARQGVETQAIAELNQGEVALQFARQEFDPQTLAAARNIFEEKGAEIAKQTANLSNATTEWKNQEKRVNEWQEACAARDTINREKGRLQAAIDLTELAREVLKNSAPAVAQHLCNHIAARAQQVFNLISHDPVMLEWDATRYSLRINPADRRFAMLSGGEQTKLALAMTLAMLHEFSALRFCIFDEPTYGVDAESRSKLADAILEAQKAAGLDQLLLVSHDDAFEGKIEHVIVIRKSAGEGSMPTAG